jgi:hypothetical protein
LNVVVEYVKEHHDELVDKDRRTEAFHKRGIEAQHARGGIFAESDERLTSAERAASLREKMKQKLAERNGAGNPD